jgi:hypothetical protein
MSSKHGAAIFAGGLGFAGAVFALHLLIPPVVTLREAKLAAFDQERDQYRLLFLGTSIVHRQIIPELFDRELSARGVAMRSFNLGLMGADAGEVYQVLEQVLRRPPARLAYLVIDGRMAEPNPENLDTWRYLSWHTPSATAADIRSLWRSDLSPGPKLAAVGSDVQAFARMMLLVGGAWRLWRNANPAAFVGPRGYYPLDWYPNGAPLHQRFLSSLDAYREHLARIAAVPPIPDASSYSRVVLAAMLDLARRHGLRVVVILAPLPEPARLFAVDAPTVSFRDQRQYPQLYAVENHFDELHLNARGAQVYTRLVAERLLPLLDAVH